MRRILLAILATILIATPALARGHRSGHHSMRSTYHAHYTRSYHHHPSNYVYGVPRDSRGRIKRSSAARHAFMEATGYPNGRKGYVIDHVVPLKRGGKDAPSNMQWQTKAEAKAKDRWE